jgi:uncharacterized protein Yka (UPF0111/DUF47 family)
MKPRDDLRARVLGQDIFITTIPSSKDAGRTIMMTSINEVLNMRKMINTLKASNSKLKHKAKELAAKVKTLEDEKDEAAMGRAYYSGLGKD